MIKITGEVKVCEGLDEFLAKAVLEATQVFRGFTVAVYFRLLVENPQWTGNAASNWNYNASGETTYLLDAGMSYVGHKGDDRGISISVMRNAGREKVVTLETPVRLSNSSVNLKKVAYIALLEENPNNFLREVNNPGHMVERTSAGASSIGVINPAMATEFKALSISGNVQFGASLVPV